VSPGAATLRREAPREAAEYREAINRYGSAFKGAMGAVRRLRGRDTHRAGELSFAQFGLLFGLEEGGELSASELASIADVAPGTATQMLDALESHGLVVRTRSVLDRRCVLVSLTERGTEVIAARRAAYRLQWDEALAGFTAAELATAATVLERTRAMFEALAGDTPEHGTPGHAAATP
jgi:DNA-binding MarR family transcriptional regulator